MSTQVKATIEDLYKVPGKAELVNGEIVHISPTGAAPNYAAGIIFASLLQFSQRQGFGRAVSDNAAFRVRLPHRESFSPDAAFFLGRSPGMKFFEGAPVFAVEVRSEGDYGTAMERAMAMKRTDYFAAGTLVVWDVDLLAEDIIKSYQAAALPEPTIFRRGEIAHAEPAVSGWSIAVNDLFEPEY